MHKLTYTDIFSLYSFVLANLFAKSSLFIHPAEQHQINLESCFSLMFSSLLALFLSPQSPEENI